MKKLTNKLLAMGILVIVLFTIVSCGKEDPADPNDGFKNELSPEIRNMIADSLVLQLEEKGMTIHRGNRPPNAEGVFLASPFELLSPYGPEDAEPGYIISDYWFKIYDQVGDQAKIDYKGGSSSDEGIGEGSFISGSGNKFTLFSEFVGNFGGEMPYSIVSVITGEISEDGIKDFQFGLVLTHKERDKQNIFLIPEGSSRVFIDNDEMASRQAHDVFAKIQMQQQIKQATLVGVK